VASAAADGLVVGVDRSELDADVALQPEPSHDGDVAVDASPVVAVEPVVLFGLGLFVLFVLAVDVAVTVAGAWLARTPPSPTSAARLAPPAIRRARRAACGRRRRGVGVRTTSLLDRGREERSAA
jgi:hypothetical protein